MSIREISTQAHFAQISYEQIYGDTDQVFMAVHAFLVHCANVSKLLSWANKRVRPTTIGDILCVTKESEIHNRRFRNSLEHYEKELQKWIYQKGPTVNIGTYNIGSKSSIQVQNMVFVKHYDPATGIFTFVDEDYELKKLFEEVARIKTLADNWLNKDYWGKMSRWNSINGNDSQVSKNI